MRPDPRLDHERNANGRIIYLGDVRRRRARRVAPSRHYLAAVALAGAAAWAVWITVLFTLAPARLLTYLAFFLPLGAALAASGTLVAYAVETRTALLPSLVRAGRRGVLAAGAVVANLAALAAHRWTPVVLLVSLVVVVVAESVLAYWAKRR